jgi:lysophospholipase L1-like esterase
MPPLVVPALSRRRRFTFALISVLLTLGLTVAALVAVDLYLHHRVEGLAAVNRWGYRGPVIGPKQKGEIRLVALGGSTAFGFGLPWTEAWPFVLGQTLNGRASGRHYTIVNLGAPGQGAYGFRFDLRDYAWLQYDAAILYEGYNDLGRSMAFDAAAGVENHYLWRRQSPVFRLTGYFPVLPLVFREKAMTLSAGGDLDAAYRGRVTFRPGLATRATAAALTHAAAVADLLGRQVGHLTPAPELSHAPLDTNSWSFYTASVVSAVAWARERGVTVIVASQPYISDAHRAQQEALAAALTARFGRDAGVRYVNLGHTIQLGDPDLAYDGMHLTAKGNRTIADHLAAAVDEITFSRTGMSQPRSEPDEASHR